ILQRSLIRSAVGAKEAHQYVGGDSHQLEPNKNQYYIEARGHAHHADHGKQHQRVKLTVMFLLDFEITNCHEDRDGSAGKEEIEEIDSKPIHQHRVHERGLAGKTASALRVDALNPP